MMRFPRRKFLPLLVVGAVIWKLWPETPANEIRVISGASMGSTWSLRSKQPEKFRDLVQECFTKWEGHLTTWRPEGGVAKMNTGSPAPPELEEILSLSQRLESDTGGYFSPRPGGTDLDLSAIGKGYAVDQAVSALRANGLTEFVLELGGEVYAAGRWPVQLPGGVISLENEAVATSGNQYQKHIIDPHSGKLVEASFASVSVIAPSCTGADAWATALFAGADEEILPEPFRCIRHP